MIALVTTCFLIFYILIPGTLFRFAASFSSIKLKAFQRTRSQEATFAVAVAIVPFLLALAGVWHMPVMRHYPFHIQEGTYAERGRDYRRAAELLLSPDLSKDLSKSPGCTPQASPCKAADPYWDALSRVLRRQGRFLSWYFVFITLEGFLFSWLAGNYGNWHNRGEEQAYRMPKAALLGLYDRFTRKFILPNISEWHVLLTNFNWPRNVLVVADVLQNDEHLYRGRVEDYFVDPDGKLTGILLRNVSRFDRNAYREAQSSTAYKGILESENFWKTIPSENFYIGYSAIANLNIRFAPGSNDELKDVTRQVLSKEDIQGVISVTDAAAEDSTFASPEEHDLYN